MDFEYIALMVAIGLALLPIGIVSQRTWLRVGLVVCWAGVALFVSPSLTGYRVAHVVSTPDGQPTEETRGDYVSSKECGACHPGEYASWRHTYHRTMTQAASPEAIFGDFDDVELDFQGWHTRLERSGDKFFAWVPDPVAGKSVKREIVLTTGSHHMQVYWYSVGAGQALGQIGFTYLKDDQRWVPRDTVFIKPPSLVPGDESGRWSSNCIVCHTTRGRPGVKTKRRADGRLESSLTNSDAVEFGISCESCHGPGGEHVRANRGNPVTRYAKHLASGSDDTIRNAARMDKKKSIAVCGQCHGPINTPDDMQKFYQEGIEYKPGDELEHVDLPVDRSKANSIDLDTLEATGTAGIETGYDQYFWSDGQFRVRGRESVGVTDSACFESGELTCLSCHKLHKSDDDPRSYKVWADDMLKPGGRTDQACEGCHPQFEVDIEAHTHHVPESSGSECMNCHMPYTTWGLLRAIRQHTINSPTATATVEAGRPNACNACHIDQTLAWTADRMNEWYGQAKPELSEDDRVVAASLQWLLEGDAGQRALAAWYLGWEPARQASGEDWIAPQLAPLLEDPYAVVRYVAAKSLQSLSGFEDLEYDFVDEASTWTLAKRQAWKAYQAQPAGSPDRGRALTAERAARLLLYEDGSHDRLALGRLLKRRDDREVAIGE